MELSCKELIHSIAMGKVSISKEELYQDEKDFLIRLFDDLGIENWDFINIRSLSGMTDRALITLEGLKMRKKIDIEDEIIDSIKERIRRYKIIEHENYIKKSWKYYYLKTPQKLLENDDIDGFLTFMFKLSG